ncbi:MAG: acetylornithine transaminase [Nitrospirae bacterium]|nr:acetylornithine transaminase [Candidatus Manganitrophaceae bacterium]
MENRTDKWIAAGDQVLMPTYARFPLVLERGVGATVTDVEGKTYLDFVSGVAVNALGHCDAKLVKQVQAQAETLLHVSNLYYNLPQIELAKILVQHSFADKVFFCNSGAEAVEAAIKLARRYAKEKMPGERFEIITAKSAFHGRTLAALAATGQAKYLAGFAPILPGFQQVLFDDVDALAKAVNENTAAVLLEPIQGEGGVQIPKPGYLAAVREICDEAGILLILDEVQTGIGRTGHLFAHQATEVVPDIMSTAKGLGGGLPIGAILAKDVVASVFQPGTHASTFGGNPLVCSAGLAVLNRLTQSPAFLEDVREKGQNLLQTLKTFQSQCPLITAVRGRGLMIALDLTIPAAEVIDAALSKGLLLNRTSEKTLRLIPPLTIQQQEIDQMVHILFEILKAKL